MFKKIEFRIVYLCTAKFSFPLDVVLITSFLYFFNPQIHQAQPSIPKARPTQGSYISTHDAEQSKLEINKNNNILSDTNNQENERYSSLDGSQTGRINDGYVSLTRSLADGSRPPSNLDYNEAFVHVGQQNPGDTYDVVGTVSMEDARESTYECPI